MFIINECNDCNNEYKQNEIMTVSSMKILTVSTMNIDNIIDSLIEFVDINYSTSEVIQGNVKNTEEQIVHQNDIIKEESLPEQPIDEEDNLETSSFDKGFLFII